ncbi:MAG: LemA family protein [Bacteroidales bacterium]
MEWIIIAGLVAALVLIGVITLKRKLTEMSNNVRNAMVQIGVQLSSRYDMLMTLLKLTEQYAGENMSGLLVSVENRRRTITATATPDDVVWQEAVIADALKAVSEAELQYPMLKENEEYLRLLEAVDGYGKMLDTSRFIYNDSVKKFNHNLSVFPANLVGPLLGFTRREYLGAY